MEIKNIKVADIIPYAKNQKKHPDVQIKNIATSISKYGFVQPVVLDANNEVIIGHGRILAAKKLKLDTVPCVYADGLTDEQIRELCIIDNKLNESEWDMDLLSLDLSELDFSDFDIDFNLDDNDDAIPAEKAREDLSDDVHSTFEVIVECINELEQEKVFNQLTSEGKTCRVLTL